MLFVLLLVVGFWGGWVCFVGGLFGWVFVGDLMWVGVWICCFGSYLGFLWTRWGWRNMVLVLWGWCFVCFGVGLGGVVLC